MRDMFPALNDPVFHARACAQALADEASERALAQTMGRPVCARRQPDNSGGWHYERLCPRAPGHDGACQWPA